MKRLLKQCGLIILAVLAFGQASLTPADAIYQPLSVANNHFGIHILDAAEIDKAANLVNSNGGDWGYVTIPIRANDRDLEKWTKFMQNCSKLHIIPILRIATFPNGSEWAAPNEWDLVDFANFLTDLPWPTKNRYVIVYNEPNHKSEWGGFVYPAEYARVLSRAADIFHKKNGDYFIIGAGLDSSAPSGSDSLNIYEYFAQMEVAVPGIFQQIDGMSYHSYGNPGFSAAPNLYSLVNINGFRNESDFLFKRFDARLPIFITESGWSHQFLSDSQMTTYYDYAFTNVWNQNDIVAVTPFLLQSGDGPFVGFSFIKTNGEFYDFAKKILDYPKSKGQPLIAQYIQPVETKPQTNAATTNSKEVAGLLKLINFIKLIFNQ